MKMSARTVSEESKTGASGECLSSERSLRSRLYHTEIWHQRTEPKFHEFSYPGFFIGVDLEELEVLDQQRNFFGYNRFSLFSINDADYFPGKEGSLHEKVRRFLEKEGVNEGIERIELITVPRVLSKVFNPVSFYRCFNAAGEQQVAIAEVNNTFGETHLYLLHTPLQGGHSQQLRYLHCKEFHVSPFNDMNGDYRFCFSKELKSLDIRINIERDGRTTFLSRIRGEGVPFSLKNVIRTLVAFPLAAHLAMPRIMWEAAKLRFRKDLKVYTKPIAQSDMTIRQVGPSYLQSACQSICVSFFEKIRRGQLILEYPDGSEKSFGKDDGTIRARISVRNYDFFMCSVISGDVGFGEAYVEGYWDTEDLTAVLSLFILNEEFLDEKSILLSSIGDFLNGVRHFVRKNSPQGSKKNISAHYDLSNELFESFLDPSMMYSSAFYVDENDTLEIAQQNKIQQMIEKADIQASDHVLEIGSGWGGFAIAAAQQTGCKVTSITLSQEQLTLARERVVAAGLSDRVRIELCDYREVQGEFDKIVSIEMLEAVGHKYLGTFFAACERVLKPNGVLALQVITMPETNYDNYRKSCDWIQKYIFPGGLCPSVQAIVDAMTADSKLIVQDMEAIGTHYARTLRDWQKRFKKAYPSLVEKGFDEHFRRMWMYYLCYCEAGFAMRKINTMQLVASRTNNRTILACPGYHTF